MYKIGLSDTYAWPVNVKHAKDGGGFEVRTFDAIFKRLNQPQLEAQDEEARQGKLRDVAFCKRNVVGWKGIQDESGQELPFSESNLEEFLKNEGVASAIVGAFYDSVRDGKEKN